MRTSIILLLILLIGHCLHTPTNGNSTGQSQPNPGHRRYSGGYGYSSRNIRSVYLPDRQGRPGAAWEKSAPITLYATVRSCWSRRENPTSAVGSNPQVTPAGGITQADNGKTFLLHPGESFLLNLGTGYI